MKRKKTIEQKKLEITKTTVKVLTTELQSVVGGNCRDTRTCAK